MTYAFLILAYLLILYGFSRFGNFLKECDKNMESQIKEEKEKQNELL